VSVMKNVTKVCHLRYPAQTFFPVIHRVLDASLIPLFFLGAYLYSSLV